MRVCSLGPDPIDADLFDGPPPDRLQLALWPPPMTYLWLLPCASQQGPEEEGERPAGREVELVCVVALKPRPLRGR